MKNFIFIIMNLIFGQWIKEALMNKYRLPTSTYDRKNDKEVTDEDIKRNFKVNQIY